MRAKNESLIDSRSSLLISKPNNRKEQRNEDLDADTSVDLINLKNSLNTESEIDLEKKGKQFMSTFNHLYQKLNEKDGKLREKWKNKQNMEKLKDDIGSSSSFYTERLGKQDIKHNSPKAKDRNQNDSFRKYLNKKN